MVHASTTPVSEVLTIIGWLTEKETVYQVNGGWGVDALVGRQTREHGGISTACTPKMPGSFMSVGC